MPSIITQLHQLLKWKTKISKQIQQLDYCNSLHFGVVIKAVEDIHADVKIKRILRHSVQMVCGFDKFRPQRIEQHLGCLQLPVVALRQCVKPQPEGVVDSVQTYCFFKVSS